MSGDFRHIFRCCLWAALSLLLTGLVGCHPEAERIIEASFERTCPVEPNARISIKNVDGSIRVYGADTREVKISAVKKAYGRDRLDKITINVAAQRDLVSIDTIYPPKPKFGLSDRSGTVDYVIVVPQTCTISRLELINGEVRIDGMRESQVSANLVNGRLFDRNGFGNHQLFVANGGLDVAYEWWEPRQFSLDAKIVNGNIRVFIPGDGAFHLLAATVDGKIANDFSEQEDRQRAPVQKIDTLVGGPSQVTLEIHATNGNINVAEANP